MKIRQFETFDHRASRTGVLFAVVAVIVTAPRLALAFLAADGVAVPPAWRVNLLAVSSIATAVVLTGGIAYLALAIAVARSGRALLVLVWSAALLCSGALISPAIVATLRAQTLAVVLGAERHWLWSVCAVLAVDLVASGTMLADVRRWSAADPVIHPAHSPGGYPSSILGHLVPGVGSLPDTLSAEPSHPCPWGCGRRFPTKDAANGHGRHCPELAAQKAEAMRLDGVAGAALPSPDQDPVATSSSINKSTTVSRSQP